MPATHELVGVSNLNKNALQPHKIERTNSRNLLSTSQKNVALSRRYNIDILLMFFFFFLLHARLWANAGSVNMLNSNN